MTRLTAIVIAGLGAAWAALLVGLVVRAVTRGGVQRKRRVDHRSLAGEVLQGAAFAALFMMGPGVRSSALSLDTAPRAAIALVCVALAIASVWFVLASMAHLGRQWSLRARLLEQHALVTTGPYRIVRHPIYTGLLGLVMATGVALARWTGLAVALPLYLAGTAIRTRAEERLLREAFGTAYGAYARRVRALVPFVW